MIRAVKIEWLKLRSNPILGMFLLVTLTIFLIGTYFFVQNFVQSYGQATPITKDPNPWHFFIESYASEIEICIGLNILLVVGWLHFVEHKNRMWVKSLLLPLPILHIILAKMTIIVIFAIIVQLLLFAFTFLFLKPYIVDRYAFLFTQDHPEPYSIYYNWFFYYLSGIFKLIIFHFWLSLKLQRSFLLAFFIGFIGLLLRFLWFSPYGFSFIIGKPRLEDIMLNVVYVLVFLYFTNREVKSYFS